jgi:hypothetical protein
MLENKPVIAGISPAVGKNINFKNHRSTGWGPIGPSLSAELVYNYNHHITICSMYGIITNIYPIKEPVM